MIDYCGILLFGQNFEFAGRGIAGPRLRTAASRAGFNVMIVDFINSLTLDQIFELLDKAITKETKFIGLSASWIDPGTIQFYPWYNVKFFDTVKRRWPNLLIITGGHDEYNKGFLLENANYHFHGYSDDSFVEFLKMIHGQDHTLTFTPMKIEDNKQVYMIDSNKNHAVTNPDDLETIFLKEDNFKKHQPLPIEVARGCIFRCGFCRHPFQGKKYYDSYQRSINNIASELSRNYELFGTTRYTVLDDTFNDSIEKVHRLTEAVKLADIPNFEFVAYIKPEILVTKPEMIDMLVDLGLKGAFIGMESFNEETRKVIGKGTKVEKVLDVCKKLGEANNNQVRVHASFIAGLPYDTPELVTETYNFLVSEQNTFFRSWHIEPLSLRIYTGTKPLAGDVLSTFDKDPESFGYKFDQRGNWYNDHWTRYQANYLAKKLMIKSQKFVRSGGWRIAGLWQAGVADENLDDNMPHKILKYLIELDTQERVSKEFNRIVKGATC